jgi:hypothetical protein
VSGRDRASSRSEALLQITMNEYDAIDLYTRTPGRDEYELVAYLAATWPSFLQRLTIRTLTPGRMSYLWSHQEARFVPAPAPPRPAPRPALRPPAATTHRESVSAR